MTAARPLLRLGLVLAALALAPAPAGAMVEPATAECAPDEPLPASAWLDRITTGWRPLEDGRKGRYGLVNERTNAEVIYRTFREAGYSHGIAFAAIVNAWAESALDANAIMDRPFTFHDPRRGGTKHYPRGTRAVGLFQLLPSTSGAGGPSGPAEGYDRTFEDRKWAGTRWQAARWGDEPDWRGRTYYNAMDPQVNTARILLEMARDGAPVVAAAERGASIAELSDLFGRYIERPQSSTRYRRRLAAKMLGRELAYARHPDRLFAPEPDPGEIAMAIDAQRCDVPIPPQPGEEQIGVARPASQFGPLLAAVAGLGTLAWGGQPPAE